MRRILLIVIASFALVATGVGLGYLLFAPATPQEKKGVRLDITDGGIYRVRSVVDGDTVVLENGLHLRYNGMNAPETMRWYKDPSPMSKEATAKNIALVEGKRIRLKLASDPIDMHGRVVANVFVVPEDPNQPEIELREVMIKEGFAKAMDVGISKDEYRTLKGWQDEAKSAQVGIWGIRDEPKTLQATDDSKAFCASGTSKIYHKSDCHVAKRISPANRHEYASADDAEAVGLRPCSICLGKK